MKKAVIIILLAAIFPLTLYAKPKKKTYNNSSEQLFAAALRTARERHVVTFVDSKQLMFTFQTGMSVWSYGFIANASIEPEGEERATLIINVQNKKGLSMGAGDRMADKFFDQVTETLAGETKQKKELHSEQKTVSVAVPKAFPNEPSMTKPESLGLAKSKGSVNLVCKTEGAEIFVDEKFVGNAPATLALEPGDHIVAVTSTGMKKWTRRLTVSDGSSLTLTVNLEPDEKRAITIQ